MAKYARAVSGRFSNKETLILSSVSLGLITDLSFQSKSKSKLLSDYHYTCPDSKHILRVSRKAEHLSELMSL